MPELPEVETMCRGIKPIIGGTIVAAERTPSPRKPIVFTPGLTAINRRLSGKKIIRVERAGKRVVLRIGDEECLVIEPRMTGLVLIDKPPTAEHLRFRLKLKGRPVKELLFWDRRGLGQIHLYKAAEFKKKILEQKLGPDALTITCDELAQKLKSRKTPIKVALLDQGLVAGVGNLYASEILFLAQVHPKTRCNRLSNQQSETIRKAMLEILNEAIAYEGSTLSDGTYRNAFNEVGDYQSQHRVYDRAGLPCPRCRSPIERIVQAQRATFFCPHCQTAGRKASTVKGRKLKVAKNKNSR